jgi:hypothetical protein
VPFPCKYTWRGREIHRGTYLSLTCTHTRRNDYPYTYTHRRYLMKYCNVVTGEEVTHELLVVDFCASVQITFIKSYHNNVIFEIYRTFSARPDDCRIPWHFSVRTGPLVRVGPEDISFCHINSSGESWSRSLVVRKCIMLSTPNNPIRVPGYLLLSRCCSLITAFLFPGTSPLEPVVNPTTHIL